MKALSQVPNPGRASGCAGSAGGLGEIKGMDAIAKPQDSGARYEAAIVQSTEERAAVFAVRMTVFVEEQAVPPEEELDAFDVVATHFLACDLTLPAGDPAAIVGAARLVDKGDSVGKVGRVAVLRAHRGRGIGALLMRKIEQIARAQGFTRLDLDAQCYAIPFYAKLGYVAEGEIFLDANIEHRKMYKLL
jgi:predicted GNAT family N-acyltransferase